MRIDPTGDHAMVVNRDRPRLAVPTRRPWQPLLGAVAKLAGTHAELIRHTERGWASVTFAGTRHTLVLAFVGAEAAPAGEAFIAALPDHEFTISGQLVADATVAAVEHTALPEQKLIVEIELLLLEDA